MTSRERKLLTTKDKKEKRNERNYSCSRKKKRTQSGEVSLQELRTMGEDNEM